MQVPHLDRCIIGPWTRAENQSSATRKHRNNLSSLGHFRNGALLVNATKQYRTIA
jgi:hypothetical protein